MAFDAFIKIDGIEGESSDEKYSNWIEALSFGCGVRQQVSRTASSVGGATAERADFHEFSFEKLIDKATPKLALACAQGRHIDSITLNLCRAGEEKIKYLEVNMSDCIISGATISKSSDPDGKEFPTEQISINYGIIKWVYTLQNRKGGSAGGNIATGWNLERNKSS